MKRLLLLSLLLPWLASAQLGGRNAYRFLNNVASARVAGQGSHAIANPENDLNFALLNPALLRSSMQGQVTTSGVDYVEDIVYGDAAYAHHFDSVGTFFAQVMFMDYGQFTRTNEIGIKQGQFDVGDYTLNIGYSRSLDSNWQLGGKIQVISSQYDNYGSWGLALDAGISYHLPEKRLMISLLARNAGFQITPYVNQRESLPFELLLGISNRFEHLPLRWQVSFVNLQRWDLRYDNPATNTVNQFTGEVEGNNIGTINNILRHMVLGLEFAPSDGFNLQFGYNFRRRQELNLATRRTGAGFSFGAGFRIYKFKIHYSRNNYHVAGGANQLTLSTDLQTFSD